jgi:hypothetical protein
MLMIWIFLITLLGSCGYAAICGSHNEKIGAASFFVAAFLSSDTISFYAEVEIGIMIIDFLLLGVLIWLLIVSKAYWPIWATGFHLVSVSAHLARWAQPDIIPIAYATYADFWAYPVLGSLIWGTRHHQWRRTMAPA